jgi:AcrR family transcriptional regulator
MNTETVGLRERKRAETRAQLEQAAVRLAIHSGLEHTTVDAISAAANVSPRTFFNYFDSKEDAVLGVHDVEITSEFIAEHEARYSGAEVTESIIGLLAHAFAPTIAFSDSATHQARIELVRRHPDLMVRRTMQFTRTSRQLTNAISELLADNPRFSGYDAIEPALSEVILALCGSAFGVAVKEWMTVGGTGTREELEARAVSLVREAQGKLL